jgi:hypothetical protein
VLKLEMGTSRVYRFVFGLRLKGWLRMNEFADDSSATSRLRGA